MVAENIVLQKIQEANDNNIKTFAEFVASIFKGKFIEIYLNDTYEEVSVDQVSTSYPAVFCGKVIGAYGACLIINSVFVDSSDHKNHAVKSGNIVFINDRNIKAFSEVDGNGTLEDMFLRSRQTLAVRNNFIGK
jgi:hypothetical protein